MFVKLVQHSVELCPRSMRAPMTSGATPTAGLVEIAMVEGIALDRVVARQAFAQIEKPLEVIAAFEEHDRSRSPRGELEPVL